MKRCEAMVLSDRLKPLYIQCGREPAELHHKLTRARGGRILDEAGETYHHIYLCREHHDYAHKHVGEDNGLMIRGSVQTVMGVPVYAGPDEYLHEHYGRPA